MWPLGQKSTTEPRQTIPLWGLTTEIRIVYQGFQEMAHCDIHDQSLNVPIESKRLMQANPEKITRDYVYIYIYIWVFPKIGVPQNG